MDRKHVMGAGLAFALSAALLSACGPSEKTNQADTENAALSGPVSGQAVLDLFLGEWDCEATTFETPGIPAKKETIRLAYTRILGGRFVEESGEGGHGLRLFTYDEQKQCYFTWFFSQYVQEDIAEIGHWDNGTRTLDWTRVPGKYSTMQFRFPNKDAIECDVRLNDDAGNAVFKADYKMSRTKEAGAAKPFDLESRGIPPDFTGERRVLDQLLGNWTNDVTLRTLSPAMDEKHATEKQVIRRVIDGYFVQQNAESSLGTSAMILYAFNPKSGRYRLWAFLSDWGGMEVPYEGTWNAAAHTMDWASPAPGEYPMTMRHRFSGDDAFDYTFWVKDPGGRTVNEGIFKMSRVGGKPQTSMGPDGTSPPTSTTYRLISIGGEPVPCSPLHEGQRVPEVSGGSMTINSDGTFSGGLQFTNPNIVVPGAANKTPGTYTREGDTLTMKHPGAGYTRATISGDTFTMDNEGLLFVYQK